MTSRHRLLSPLVLGCCYLLTASFAIAFTRFEGGVACLWIATAVLAADLVTRRPKHWWPSILACAIASTTATIVLGLGWVLAIPFTVVNMVEAMVAAGLLRMFARKRQTFGSLGLMTQFVVSVLMAASIAGVIAATAAHHLGGMAFGPTLTSFIAGHGLGSLTFIPIALLLMTRKSRRSVLRDLRHRSTAETVALLMLSIVVSALVFSVDGLPLLFLPALPIIVIASRLGRSGVALSIAMLALIGGLATASGQGPIQLVDASLADRMLFFQFYLAATVLTLLPVTDDLANRARLHRKMRESEAGYRLIADHSSDMIFSLKVDGTIRYASPSCRQLGYTPAQIVGRNCGSLIAPEHLEAATAAHLRSLEIGGETNRFEYLALTATGERRWAETHARLIIDDAGHPDGVLSIVRDIHQQKLTELKLSEAALVDSLTGLSNRLAYREEVERRHPHADQVGACVAMLDIDHFKSVNDRYGHDAGDLVLQGFADVARRVVREGDLVARLGGEEFAIFFPDTTLPQALAICDRLRSELGGTIFRAGTNAIVVTVSGGVAELGSDGIDAALKIADMALYRAKQAGRNQLALAA